MCTRLEEEATRRRTAYDATIRNLDQLSRQPPNERYEATKNLADHMWVKLEIASQELEDHRQMHLAQERKSGVPSV